MLSKDKNSSITGQFNLSGFTPSGHATFRNLPQCRGIGHRAVHPGRRLKPYHPLPEKYYFKGGI
jgi:hypothetical protein